MKNSYLEVTYRKGRALAAYLYLRRRPGDVSVRTERSAGGFVVDYAAEGRPIGIEILSPARFDLASLNESLSSLGLDTVRPEDCAPLVAA